MNINPETAELREVVRQTVEMVEQNAKDNAYLRGAFEQMERRFEVIEGWISGIEGQLNTQLR